MVFGCVSAASAAYCLSLLFILVLRVSYPLFSPLPSSFVPFSLPPSLSLALHLPPPPVRTGGGFEEFAGYITKHAEVEIRKMAAQASRAAPPTPASKGKGRSASPARKGKGGDAKPGAKGKAGGGAAKGAKTGKRAASPARNKKKA